MLGNPARFSVGEVGQPGVSLSSAQLALTGDVATLGKALSAHVRLSNAADGAVLWSGDFSGDPAQAQALRERVATRVGSILNCALSTRNRGAAAIGYDVTRLYLDACDRIGDYDLNGALAPLRKVTSLAPGFARAWADLATTQALAADDLPPAQQAAADREAAANARRALALDGQTGLAYYALAHALPGLSNWESRVALIAKGLQAEPDSSELNNAMGVELLRVGRTGEAISYLQRSANLDPLNPSKSLALIWTLAFSGQFDDAEALIAKEERLWPGNVMIWDTAFTVEAEAGDPAKALALLDDPQRPGVRDPQDVGVWRALIRARAQPTGPNVDAAVAALLAQPPSDQADVLQMAHDLSRLGRMDLAYQYASKAKPTDDGAIDLLFRSYMAPFRADPRFMALMARLGVVDVWRSTNHWPDFCTAAQPPYNCADEAARAVAREKSAG
jgi:tetratricopeptide (TPR) repeat protein